MSGEKEALSAREAAYRSLLRIEKESRYSNLETDVTLRRTELSPRDARLYTRLVYGVIERKLTLDYILALFTRGDFSKLDREVSVLLRLGAYQMLFADRVPDSAAVNETVELCKKYKKSASTLVNAVLRRLAREKDALTYPAREDDPAFYLSVRYSVSRDLCALLLEQFSADECEKLLAAFGEPPKTTLRVNTLRTSREALCEALEKEGVAAERTPFSPVGLRVDANVRALTALEKGLCFVQDEASQLAVQALDARPGMTVMDLCACPGGKSVGAALTMENRGAVLSFDLHANKLPLIAENAARLGVAIIRTAAADARVFLPEYENSADRVLVDAPCSGLGVMAKKPDLRYKNADDIARLPEIQLAILENAAHYVRPGGRMVYSTCTLLSRENERIVDAFLAAHPDFAPDDLRLPAFAGQTRVTLLPHIHRTDGFFIAAIKKL